MAFQSQLQQAFAPLGALGAMLHDNPDWQRIDPRFDSIAQELLEQVCGRGGGGDVGEGCTYMFLTEMLHLAIMASTGPQDDGCRMCPLAVGRTGKPVVFLCLFSIASQRIPKFCPFSSIQMRDIISGAMGSVSLSRWRQRVLVQGRGHGVVAWVFLWAACLCWTGCLRTYRCCLLGTSFAMMHLNVFVDMLCCFSSVGGSLLRMLKVTSLSLVYLLLLLLLQLPVVGAVSSLQLIPQGIVQNFYPLPGNEAALYHNIFKGKEPLLDLTSRVANPLVYSRRCGKQYGCGAGRYLVVDWFCPGLSVPLLPSNRAQVVCVV